MREGQSRSVMMKMCAAGGAKGHAKLERKTLEKSRRMHMKSLCLQLSAVVPIDYSTDRKDVLTLKDNLEQATSYIRALAERIDKLTETVSLLRRNSVRRDELPIVEVRHNDASMEVVVVSRACRKRFMFHELISLVEEEGDQVVHASFSVVGDKIFHTIRSQAVSSNVGAEISTVTERLKALVN